ncbi:MAG: hypothetical protein QY325_12400 [Flavobacteriales bacterium]|nr:MAG: hypothetical protein QY325_12400 [Flavobacteriales bacterium]
MQRRALLTLLAIMAVVIACRHEREEVVAPAFPSVPGEGVSVDLDLVPYPSLSQYRFFTGALADHEPNAGVLPYDVITPLFSDYAHKFRFVWMPPGSSALFNGEDVPLDFPDGTVLIKTFYFDRVLPADERRILETRLLIKRGGQWLFADYIWNAEQTEATLDLNGRFVPLSWRDEAGIQHDLTYRIPAAAECFTCHKLNDMAMPIGPKLRNMARTMDYPEGPRDQIGKWVEAGFLQPGFPPPVPVARWNDPSASLNERVRAYVDMNCAHCHAEGKHCDYRPMRFAWEETVDPINLGVCVEPEDPLPENPELAYIVAPSNTYRSMLLHRLSSTEEAVRMPLMGRTVVHEEAVQLFTEWINSLPEPCN